jgi:hypothetical protein
MAKKTARSKPNRALHLDQLTGRANDIASTILNSIAFQKHGDCCGVDDLAEQFETTPARLNTTLRKLEVGGLITIEGKVYQTIYPTVKMLREQDSTLSSADAEKIIRRLRRL